MFKVHALEQDDIFCNSMLGYSFFVPKVSLSEVFLLCICLLTSSAHALYHVYTFRGEPKCWYSVPGSEADAFEKVSYYFKMEHLTF